MSNIIDNNKLLLNYVNDNKWNNIMQIIKKNGKMNINGLIANGNNIFHLACVKGKTKIIDKLIKLSENGKIELNIDLANADGYPGLHLYYMYGGNNKKYLEKKNVCVLDNKYISLINYLYDKIDLLEIFINSIIQHECFENIHLSEYSILSNLIKQYKYYEHIDKNIAEHYYNLIIKIYEITQDKQFVFSAIINDVLRFIKYLISIEYKFTNIMHRNQSTPLGVAVYHQKYEITEEILKYIKTSENDYYVYMYIHESSKVYSNIAIMSIIINQDDKMMNIIIKYMKPYIKKYEKDNNNTLLFNQFDDEHNTYLHKILLSKYIDRIPINFLDFFIKHTDLNKMNYKGETSAHLIFKLGIWKNIKKMLIGREIDMLKTDNIGNNCYSYIDKKDADELLELTKQIKIPISVLNAKEITKIFNNKKMLDNDNKNNKSRNYGLFGNYTIHVLLYLKYIDNKYPIAYIPKIKYDKTAKDDLLFLYDMTSFNTNNIQDMLIIENRGRIENYYSWLPSIIFWYDKDKYYIYHKLINVLKTHNDTVPQVKQKYIIFYISVKNDSGGHANCLIYDRYKKEAFRFESYGITDMHGKTDINDVNDLDKILHNLLESVYGKITYYDPDKYLQGLNFQLVDGEDMKQNIGDPGGYCLAWTFWFIDVVLEHQEYDVKYIMRNFFSKKQISDIISDEEDGNTKIRTTNYYLDFIRRYAHKLDNEKNKILDSIGIKKYNMYNIHKTKSDMNKIVEYFKVKE